jgi:choline dehydrogenase-like flavoprotein
LIATRSFALIDNYPGDCRRAFAITAAASSAPRGLFVPIIAPATINSITARKLPSAAANLPVPRITYSYCDNDNKLIKHSLAFMRQSLDLTGAREIWDETDDTCHLNGTARMGDDPRTSVVNADCRSWRRLGVSHGGRGQSVADNPGDRLPHRRPKAMAARGEL